MSEVRVKNYSCWNWSPSFMFGRTPKVNMVCGKCNYTWTRRFEPSDFKKGYPRSLCPDCNTVNYVPLVVT